MEDEKRGKRKVLKPVYLDPKIAPPPAKRVTPEYYSRQMDSVKAQEKEMYDRIQEHLKSELEKENIKHAKYIIASIKKERASEAGVLRDAVKLAKVKAHLQIEDNIHNIKIQGEQRRLMLEEGIRTHHARMVEEMRTQHRRAYRELGAKLNELVSGRDQGISGLFSEEPPRVKRGAKKAAAPARSLPRPEPVFEEIHLDEDVVPKKYRKSKTGLPLPK